MAAADPLASSSSTRADSRYEGRDSERTVLMPASGDRYRERMSSKTPLLPIPAEDQFRATSGRLVAAGLGPLVVTCFRGGITDVDLREVHAWQRAYVDRTGPFFSMTRVIDGSLDLDDETRAQARVYIDDFAEENKSGAILLRSAG